MKKKILIAISIILLIMIIGCLIFIINYKKPENVLMRYFSLINEGKYSELEKFVNLPEDYSQENFLKRNTNIYTGIDAEDISIEIKNVEKEKKSAKVTYINKLKVKDQIVEFENTANFTKENLDYKIDWSSNLIFPELNNEYKVRVRAVHAKRGEIYDRNGLLLAYYGKISNVGIVPGKLSENKEIDIEKISELLNISVEKINKELSSSWVKDDTFVPIKNISYDETELKEKLLEIPGIMISSETDRVYPYKEATAHVTGYISSITAEELESRKDKGYSSTSILGKSGVERAYEERLKGNDGIGVYVEDENGNIIKKVIETEAQDGENIKLTIDAIMQVKLYDALKEEQGFFVVMNPKTGEILALVSTPSYDPNKFILGLTNDEWTEMSDGEKRPMYSKFLGSWCPGSTMKPLTGAIGLTTGTLTVDDEFNYSGLAWKRDNWTDHEITTLTAYGERKNLRNALIYSDNIYFAQATLQIGEEVFTDGLDKLMFNQDIGFEFSTSKSQYSNTDKIVSEAKIADSGYGQGQVLVNPIHMASIYSAFENEGNMIKPYLEYKEDKEVEYLVENAFTKEAADEIKEGLIQVVENPSGTGRDVKVQGVTIAGKTGTAELKATKDDEGDTLGWFNCFTTDQEVEDSLLIVSMAKNKPTVFLKSIIRNLISSY